MTTTALYTCRYCRLSGDPSGVTCPNCGAPIDARAIVSRTGWLQQPPIPDLARIQFGQSRVQIGGSQVPVADFELAGSDWTFFANQALLWSDASTQLTRFDEPDGWSRSVSGVTSWLMRATGPGHVALSDNHAGEIIALPLQPSQRIWVRENRFLAATGAVGYDSHYNQLFIETQEPTSQNGEAPAQEKHYPLGQYGDIFGAAATPGLVLLHAPGNTFIRDLAQNETILLQPSALLYRDLTVHVRLFVEYPTTNDFAWRHRYEQRTVWLQARGPGRVAVQSVYARPESADRIVDYSYGTTVQRW
jgi:uncharacterized protein (AIM24 family)